RHRVAGHPYRDHKDRARARGNQECAFDALDGLGMGETPNRNQKHRAGNKDRHRSQIEETLNHVNADLAGKRLAGLLRYQVRTGEIGEAAKKSDAREPNDLRANQRQNRYALTVAHEHGPPHRANDVTPINANNGGYDVPPVQIGELHAECCEIEVNPALRPDSKACQSSQDNQADDPSSLLQAYFAPCGESLTSMLRAETQE